MFGSVLLVNRFGVSVEQSRNPISELFMEYLLLCFSVHVYILVVLAILSRALGEYS